MLAQPALFTRPRDPSPPSGGCRGLLLVSAIAAAVGCTSCSSCQCGREPTESELPDGAVARPRPPPPAVTVRPAKGWAWYDTGVRAKVALPRGCEYVGPPLRAEVSASMRWASATDQRGTILVATGGDGATEAAPWRASHAGALRWAEGKEQRELPAVEPVPWLGCPRCPAARDATGGTWLLAWTTEQAEGPTRAWAWRAGSVELVAEGDRLEVADVACDRKGRCGVLTSRVARVARPGADLWVGGMSDPLDRWQHHGMDLDWSGGGVPLSLLWDESTGVPVVAFDSAGTMRLATAAADGTAVERETFDAPHGAIAATLTPRPAALSWLSTPEGGCAAGRPGVGFQRAGGARHELPTVAAPVRASLSALGTGFWIDVLAPARCGDRSLVAYGAIASADGDEAPRLTALTEADDFAVTIEDEALDVWVRRGSIATWIRARCAAGGTSSTDEPDGADAVPTPPRDSATPSATAEPARSMPAQ